MTGSPHKIAPVNVAGQATGKSPSSGAKMPHGVREVSVKGAEERSSDGGLA